MHVVLLPIHFGSTSPHQALPMTLWPYVRVCISVQMRILADGRVVCLVWLAREVSTTTSTALSHSGSCVWLTPPPTPCWSMRPMSSSHHDTPYSTSYQSSCTSNSNDSSTCTSCTACLDCPLRLFLWLICGVANLCAGLCVCCNASQRCHSRMACPHTRCHSLPSSPLMPSSRDGRTTRDTSRRGTHAHTHPHTHAHKHTSTCPQLLLFCFLHFPRFAHVFGRLVSSQPQPYL